MPIELTMPQQSDTMTEGTVVKWRKQEGDAIKPGEVIAEIETDKAVMEMEAFDEHAGTLAVILARQGDKVAVGKPIAVIAARGEDPVQVKSQYGGPAQQPAALKNTESAAGGAAAGAGAGRVKPPSPEQGGTVGTLEGASAGEMHEPDEVGHGATRQPDRLVELPPARGGNGRESGERVRVSPLARRIAQERGIDLSQVHGSGPGGRIVQKDVMDFIDRGGPAAALTAPAAAAKRPSGGGAPAAPAPPAPALPARVPLGQMQKIPLSKMRQAIAGALQRSKQHVPHFYENIDIDVEEVVALRQRLNARLEKEGVRLSIGDFVAQAVCAALKLHPALNATFDAQKNEITRYGDIHLGIAVALPEGLIVPVLRNAGQMGLREIRVRSADLVERARAQRLKGEEMRGATFTVTNLGAYGVRDFMAIINPPEVAILAVGAAEKRAVVRNNQVVPRTMLTVTISADHRAVDGATAAEFLKTLKELLEEPGMMLM